MKDSRLVHYKIDIDIIQKEHSLILHKFHEVFTELENKKDIQELLNIIYKNLLSHFESEEKFMVKNNYPYVINHKNEHRKIALYFKNKIVNSTKETHGKYLVSILQELFFKTY